MLAETPEGAVTATPSPANPNYLVQWAERVLVALLYLNLLARLAPSVALQPQIALLLISEGLSVALILLNRRGPMVLSPYAVAVALVGTSATMLVVSGGPVFINNITAVAIICAGLLLNISAKFTLRRSFGVVAANRGVRVGGPYAFIRHPMYLGYITAQAGFLLANFSTRNAIIYALAWTAQVLRIREEEKILLRDPDYQGFARRVRFRLIPGLY